MLLAIPLSVVLAIYAAVSHRYRAANDLMRLLDGDASLSLIALEIEYQQRSVICTDPIALDFIASAMRNQPEANDESSTSYYFTFHFSTGRQYGVGGAAGTNQFSLAADNNLDGWPTHLVDLNDNPPDPIIQIFNFLQQPWEDVGGLVLRSDGEIEYEYVPRLHSGNPRGKRINELCTD